MGIQKCIRHYVTSGIRARLRGSVAEIVWVRSVKAQTVSLGYGRPRRGNGRKPEDEGEGGVAETVLKGLESVSDEISCLTDAVDYKLESLKADLRLVKLVVANSGTDGSAVAPKVRVPDPKPFGGERSAKELEKLLVGHGNVFSGSESARYGEGVYHKHVSHRDAKLWWVSRLSDDASANRERIETWEVLKKELKDQFLPCNTSWLARESLRNLKHTGTVREFVKEFSSLMLDDLPTAIAAADRLGDYKVPNEPEQRSDDSGDGKAKFDSEQETGPARVGAMQLGTLQVQSRGVGRHIRKVWLWYQAESTLGLDVRTWDSRVKAVNSKAVPVSGVADAELCVGSWCGQCKFVAVGLDDFDVILGIDFFVNANVIILPRMCGIFISGGDKPSFVKGEYDGGTEAGKKSGVAEARSSKASSSKEGAHSPRLAGFSCIGTMQEEMHRRWTKA
ncbi:UNVERIFIED_CONTAM: hypothetical protein Sangu_0183600 [Sesamum angustifolium]|uniref:Retrotransposon gag domain-containing protein n=1 Tax=Sesamum angustifolium TaxID=2727405 RepID=A0AAW2RM78_9LAMI